MTDSQIQWTRAQRSFARARNLPLVALGYYTHGKGTTVAFTAVDTYGIGPTIKRLIVRLTGPELQPLPPAARENLAEKLRDLAKQYRDCPPENPHWALAAAAHLDMLADELGS